MDQGPTSNAFSKRVPNACKTKLICKLCGTYAIPPLTNTLRPPIRSGTVYHGTYRHRLSSETWYMEIQVDSP